MDDLEALAAKIVPAEKTYDLAAAIFEASQDGLPTLSELRKAASSYVE